MNQQPKARRHRFFLSAAIAVSFLVSPVHATKAPPAVSLKGNAGNVGYRIDIRPASVKPGETAKLQISLSEATDDKKIGMAIAKPVVDATLVGYLVPPKSAKKAPILAQEALALESRGFYGVSFTAQAEGVHTLILKGSSPTYGKFEIKRHLSYGVWPIPEDAPLASLPSRRVPKPVLGNLRHGKALCEKHCQPGLGFTLPAAGAPTFIRSAEATIMGPMGLLQQVVGEDAADNLDELEQNDLAAYLSNLHFRIHDLFPQAAQVLIGEFTINEYGRERLADSAGLELQDESATAHVFVVYKADSPVKPPSLFAIDDPITRAELERSNKIGYAVFLDTGHSEHFEIAFALGREPIYPIISVHTRNANGEAKSSTQKQLKAFRGQGRFNDPRSLRRGSSKLKKLILPHYLKAAELATMYYADEREFTMDDD